MAWRRNQCAFEQFMDQITRIAVNCMQSLALQNETLNAQVITGKTHIRAETSALQRTFRFTPLGLAFCFFPGMAVGVQQGWALARAKGRGARR